MGYKGLMYYLYDIAEYLPEAGRKRNMWEMYHMFVYYFIYWLCISCYTFIKNNTLKSHYIYMLKHQDLNLESLSYESCFSQLFR